MSHPWLSAWREFEADTLPLLREHGKAIGAASTDGDETARRIIGHYQMLERSFDPMTHLFLRECLNKWLARKDRQ